MPKTYTVKEIADVLGYSTNSIYTFLKEKRIKGIRVGRGRFRISEEELARIMHLSKLPPRDMAPVMLRGENVSLLGRVQSGLVMESPQLVPSAERTLDGQDGQLPSIFDWMVGVAAMIAGAGLFVFNASFGDAQSATMVSFFPAIRLILIAAGLGMVLSGLDPKSKGWHTAFRWVLVLLGVVNAYALARSGDMDGAVTYGSLAAIIALSNIVHIGAMASVGLYVSVLCIATPILYIVAPSIVATSTAGFFGQSSRVFGTWLLPISVVLAGLYWIGYRGQKAAFHLGTWAIGIGLILEALGFAVLQFWSRAFFLIVIGFFTAMTPFWWHLQQALSGRRYRMLLHGLFAGMAVILGVAIMVVYLLQQSIWYENEQEFTTKLTVAEHTIAASLDSVKSAMLVASKNSDFVAALAKKDVTALGRLAKIIYESNAYVRRLVFLDSNGNGTALYPYGTFDEPNFAYREYFTKARDTGQVYVSGLFQAKSDNAGRYVVVISVPLFDAKSKFVGVMSASVDLEKIAVEIGQIATESRGEYFVVVDETGKYLIHKYPDLIGTTAPSDDVIRKGIAGEQGVVFGRLSTGMAGMIAYGRVTSPHWGIRLQALAYQVYQLRFSLTLLLFGAVVSGLILAMCSFWYIRMRVGTGKEGGP